MNGRVFDALHNPRLEQRRIFFREQHGFRWFCSNVAGPDSPLTEHWRGWDS